MRCVIQRVGRAEVTIEARTVGRIGPGLLVLVGVEEGDTSADADWVAEKTARMRIFADEASKMNRSVVDIDGGLLVVSQFTLHASTSLVAGLLSTHCRFSVKRSRHHWTSYAKRSRLTCSGQRQMASASGCSALLRHTDMHRLWIR